mgnify:CR=1 FL=1
MKLEFALEMQISLGQRIHIQVADDYKRGAVLIESGHFVGPGLSGKIVPSAAAATVAIAEDNSRVCGSGLSCFGTTTAGAFAVVGAANETVTVAIDNPSITLTDGGSNSMAVLLATTTSAMTLSGTGDGSGLEMPA